MATITKRDNSFHIMVSCGYDIHNRQIRKCMTWIPDSGMTHRQIEKAVTEAAILFENKVRLGQVAQTNATLADFVERWLLEYAGKQLAPKTIWRYKQFLERILPAIGHIRLDKLQPMHLIEFYNNLSEEGTRNSDTWIIRPALLEKYKAQNHMPTVFAKQAKIGSATLNSILAGKPCKRYIAERMCDAMGATLSRGFKESEGKKTLAKRTLQHYHRLISSILNTAVIWQVIPDNPAKRVKPPKAPRLEAKYLDEQQVMKLLEFLMEEPIKYRTIIKLLIYSGMRRGELCGLEWKDINWIKGTISIRRSSQYLPDGGVFTKDTKTETSDRTIRLPAEVFEMLKEYRAWQNEERLRLGKCWQEHDRLFTTFDGSPIFPDTITSWFREFIRRKDLPHVTIHSLRHTNITLLIMAGVPLQTVAKRAGHASAVTTSMIYSHAIQTVDEMASDTLADILKPKQVGAAR
jgi:integrase